MGMYTGLRGVIKVPGEYMEAFSNVFIIYSERPLAKTRE